MVIVIVAFAELGLSVWFTVLVTSLSGTLVSAIEILLSEIPDRTKPAKIATIATKTTNLLIFVFNYNLR